MVSKPISLRPSNEEQAILDRYMKNNKIKKTSVALKQIIRDFATLQTQLEQQKVEQVPQTPFSPLDEKQATGHLIKCPRWSIGVPYEDPFVKWNPPVDTSVCKTCPKYPCETWHDLESIKRTSKDPLVEATLRSIKNDSPNVATANGSHNPRP